MDWKKLLESLLPGLLQFLEAALSSAVGNPRTEAEKLAAAVNISQHALAVAGVPSPPDDQVATIVEATAHKMKAEGKPDPTTEKDPSGRSRPHEVGEVMR